jgi:hypothetical protein
VQNPLGTQDEVIALREASVLFERELSVLLHPMWMPSLSK